MNSAVASTEQSLQEPVAAKYSVAEEFRRFGRWIVENPMPALLLCAILVTLAYFYGFLKYFTFQPQSVLVWAWYSWSPRMNQEHSRLVPVIVAFLFWYHRGKIRSAPKQPSRAGLYIVGAGVLLYLLGVRTLQPRISLFSVPVLLLGIVWYLWGRSVARVVLFPLAFMVFAIPVGALEQATFRLQFIVTGFVTALSNLIGVSVAAVGTTLTAQDGTFNFEIAEGCSGIRSIVALTMLTAVYVHLTQRKLWKKLLIFASAPLFAIIGNIGRVFTVILVARFYDPIIAGGLYHDYSGFIFFPIGLAAMIGFGKLLNLRLWQKGGAPGSQVPSQKREVISYDY